MRILTLLSAMILPLSLSALADDVNDDVYAYNKVEEEYFGADAEDEDDFSDEDEDDFSEEEDEDFYGDDDFISIATGTKKTISKAPAVASVITEDDIKKMDPESINELLQRVVGLHVMPSNLSRLDTMYVIRGIGSGFNPQVLVMLNGIEIKKSATSGLPSTFTFPVTNIARIEVIRGPGSAVYGADAYSGVINIITKTSEENNIEVGARSGSWDTTNYWVNANYVGDEFTARLAISKMQSDGDHERIAEDDLQTVFDGAMSTSASIAPTHLASHYDVTNVQLDLKYGNLKFENWWWQQDDGGQGAGGAQAVDHTGTHDYDSYRGVISYDHHLSANTDVNVQAYYQRALEASILHLFPAGATFPIDNTGSLSFENPVGVVTFSEGFIGTPTFNQKDNAISATITNRTFTDHALRFNFGYVHKDLDTTERKNFGPGVLDTAALNGNPLPAVVNGDLTNVSNTEFVFISDTDREQMFFSMQDEWRLTNDFELVVGVRYDRYSDFGSTVNPRMAMVWQNSNKLTTKFLYGSAFRAPAFDELYNANNPALLGNLDLTPEEVDTFELAWDYRPSFDSKVVLSLFKYKADNLITLVLQEDNSAKQKENAAQQDGYGFELESSWKLTEDLNFGFGVSYQNSKTHGIGDDVVQPEYTVPDVPTRTAMASLDYKLNDEIDVYWQAYYVAGRHRLAADARDEIADYWHNDLSVRYHPVGADYQLSFSIKNLLDKEYKEPSDGSISNDFVMPHLQWSVKLEYSF